MFVSSSLKSVLKEVCAQVQGWGQQGCQAALSSTCPSLFLRWDPCSGPRSNRCNPRSYQASRSTVVPGIHINQHRKQAFHWQSPWFYCPPVLLGHAQLRLYNSLGSRNR